MLRSDCTDAQADRDIRCSAYEVRTLYLCRESILLIYTSTSIDLHSIHGHLYIINMYGIYLQYVDVHAWAGSVDRHRTAGSRSAQYVISPAHFKHTAKQPNEIVFKNKLNNSLMSYDVQIFRLDTVPETVLPYVSQTVWCVPPHVHNKGL